MALTLLTQHTSTFAKSAPAEETQNTKPGEGGGG